MADPQATSIPRVHGKLILSPTNNNDPGNNFGGTVLGAVRRVRFEPGYDQFNVVDEFHSQVNEVIHLQRNCLLGLLLRGWDADALNTLFPGYVSSSGEDIVRFPGGFESGNKTSGRTVKILYAARRSEHPSVILYKAFPLLEPALELRKSILNDLEIPVFFLATRDILGKLGEIGPIAGLTI